MKTCDEMVHSLLERREQYVAAQKKKKKVLVSTITALCAVAMVGVAVWQMPSMTEQPPVTLGTTATAQSAPKTTMTTAPQNTTTPTASTSASSAATDPTADITAPSKTQATVSTPQSATGKTQPTETVTQTQTTVTQTQPTQTTVTTQSTTTQTKPTTTQTQPTQTTPTTQPTITDPFDDVPVDPMPDWPYLWIIYESGENYANGEVPIYFKLEGFEEVPFDWVKETSYTADGFSVVGDITVERDAKTGALIYRMVLAYDGVTPKPSFFFSVVTADGMTQTDGLHGYSADHGFFVSCSYDSAVSSGYYYLVKTGVITFDEYQAIMEKYYSGIINGNMSWS